MELGAKVPLFWSHNKKSREAQNVDIPYCKSQRRMNPAKLIDTETEGSDRAAILKKKCLLCCEFTLHSACCTGSLAAWARFGGPHGDSLDNPPCEFLFSFKYSIRQNRSWKIELCSASKDNAYSPSRVRGNINECACMHRSRVHNSHNREG